MGRFHMRAVSMAFVLVAVGHTVLPATVRAGDGEVGLSAFLDGKPIPLSDVGRYFCDDFDYPVIRCSASRLLAATRGTVTSLVGANDYVTIYEDTGYGGAWMHISQDYASLITIGWNDRISSFKARNGETGRFTTDWFFNGTYYYFCCNSQLFSLGTWDNKFSAVQRT